MESKPTTAYRWGLRAVVALQCVLIFAFIYRGISAPGPFGPRLPATQGETMWLESHGALHQFDREGKRLRRIALSALQLSSRPTSLQFTQEHVFWVHDQSRVQRCDLLQTRCTALNLPDLSAREDYRWVRVSDDEAEIVISDASAHRVLVYQRSASDGRYTLQHNLADGMRFPNQTLQTPEWLWIANTNQHQIVQLRKPALTPQTRHDHAIAHPDLRPTRRYPFAMARDPQERLWVLVGDIGMRDADLLVMGPKHHPERVIPLAPGQDPNGIVLFDQHMLVTDMTHFVVQRLDLQGKVLAPFGDAAFQAELADAHQQAQWARRLPNLLLTSIGVLLVVALWLAWKAGELGQLRGSAWRQPVQAKPAPQVAAPQARTAAPTERGPVTVVSALPGTTRSARRVLLVGSAVMFGIVAAFGYEALPHIRQYCSTGTSCMAWEGAAVAAFLLLPLLTLALGWRQLKSLESIRIGTDGIQIQAQVGSRRYKAPAEQATCTRQHLLIGTGVIPLRYRGAPLFDESALRRDILDRLPQLHMHDNLWSNGQLEHLWKHTGWRGKLSVLGLGTMVVVALGLMITNR